MTKEKKIEADKIHILNIRTLRGNIDCPIDADINQVAGHLFRFDLKTALNKDGGMIGLKLQVDITAVDKKNKTLPITGSYTHEIIFRIENLAIFIDEAKGEQVIDARLGSTLVSIIYSTVRGIIYSRTQGTSLGVVILPVIAPLALMGVKENERQNDRSMTKVKPSQTAKKSKPTDNTN